MESRPTKWPGWSLFLRVAHELCCEVMSSGHCAGHEIFAALCSCWKKKSAHGLVMALTSAVVYTSHFRDDKSNVTASHPAATGIRQGKWDRRSGWRARQGGEGAVTDNNCLFILSSVMVLVLLLTFKSENWRSEYQLRAHSLGK